MNVFLIERLMGIFWVVIQQFCFVCVKYAHDDIAWGRGNGGRLIVSQCLALSVLVLYCFDAELGLNLASGRMLLGRFDCYPWSVRIAVCCAMIIFDSLLVLYFWRIVRVYRYGRESASPTLAVDLSIAAVFLLLGAAYYRYSYAVALSRDFTAENYVWIGRFFIQISNFFYIGLEVGGALLLLSFLKTLRAERRGGLLGA